jgi:cysteine desulfurase / selenocysteine lyase
VGVASTGLDAIVPRSDFPALEEVTYCNSASLGLPPLPVRAAAREMDDLLAKGTVAFDDEIEARVYDGARAAVGELINVAPDDVAITCSVTEAIAQLAWSLMPGPGVNVVSTNIEFPSVTYPWLRVAQATGTEVRLVDVIDRPGELTVDDVAAAVDRDTAVICISHVQYASGALLDPSELVALARAHDALLLLDCYQSAGVVPIDARLWDLDFLVGGGLKWLGGMAGAAFCYVRPELLDDLNPGIVGWRSTPSPPDFDARQIELAPAARRLEYATMPYSAGIGLAAAIRYLLDVGIERVLEHSHALGERLIAGIDAVGAEVITPRERERRAGLMNITVPGRDQAEVTRALNRAKVICSPRLGGSRFSLHCFNSGADVDRALEAIAGLHAR